jgi:HK97 gp10 family phage protein
MSKIQISFKPMSAKGALLGGPNFLANIQKMARKATFVAATKAQKKMSTMIRLPKAGKVYTRRSVKHRASAPGQAPANDTGNLIGSIQTVQMPDQGGAVASKVIVSAKYAKWLEYGTRRMAARPFVGPTKDWVAPIFKEYMAQKLRKMNKGETGENGGGEG